MTPNTDPSSVTAPPCKKPRFAFAIATVFGVGYIPKAPGTFGSLVGVLAATVMMWLGFRNLVKYEMERKLHFWTNGFTPSYLDMLVAVLVAFVGVVVAHRVAKYAGTEDPQYVVIDEVSGQLLTYSMPFFVFTWKSLLLGFILFRVFDIWKPYPIRHLEKLPGGWGIMADDWLAGIYAAILLRLAVHFIL
jgi:phosphatidylglycerophosphatase A